MKSEQAQVRPKSALIYTREQLCWLSVRRWAEGVLAGFGLGAIVYVWLLYKVCT